MKIGIVISSFTQCIPYTTYFVSNGYDVIPIILENEEYIEEKESIYLKNIIRNITQKEIVDIDHLPKDYELDCLIFLDVSKDIQTLKNIDYSSILKTNAPIIINSHTKMDTQLESLSDCTMHSINYLPLNIIDECNHVIKEVNNVLQKKVTHIC